MTAANCSTASRGYGPPGLVTATRRLWRRCKRRWPSWITAWASRWVTRKCSSSPPGSPIWHRRALPAASSPTRVQSLPTPHSRSPWPITAPVARGSAPASSAASGATTGSTSAACRWAVFRATARYSAPRCCRASITFATPIHSPTWPSRAASRAGAPIWPTTWSACARCTTPAILPHLLSSRWPAPPAFWCRPSAISSACARSAIATAFC